MSEGNGQLRSIVERVESLHEDRDAIASEIRDVFAEAKSNGFDVKALKFVIARRRKDSSELSEFEAMVELYESALGARDTTRMQVRGVAE